MEILYRQIENPIWSGELQEIVSGENGSFDFSDTKVGSPLGQEWYQFYLQGPNETIGFGWFDVEGEEAEISVAVKREIRDQTKGVGTFIVSNLEKIIHEKGIETAIATVKAKNPNKIDVLKWL